MTSAPILLDTCALIWLAGDQPRSQEAEQAINDQWSAGSRLVVSPISAWEIGLLTSKGRLSISQPVELWWDRLLATEGLTLGAMPPTVLMASSLLPGTPPNDPADRIMAATARAFGYRLMTRDQRLLAYAQAGHLQAISC